MARFKVRAGAVKLLPFTIWIAGSTGCREEGPETDATGTEGPRINIADTILTSC